MAKKRIRYSRERIIAQAIHLRHTGIVLDVETTGGAVDDEVIEMSIVRAKDGKVLYDSRFKPQQKIKYFARNIHGISDYMLQRCPTFPDQYGRIYEILHGATILAWGEFNDRRFLKQTFDRYSLAIPEISWVCAMRLHQDYENLSAPTKLSEACRMYGLTSGDHSAKADALAAARVVYKISLGGAEQIRVVTDSYQPEII